MIRPVRITRQSERDSQTVTFSAESDDGGLMVRFGALAWERLELAFMMLDADDRREAALMELEQIAGMRLDELGDDRLLILSDDLVNAVADMRERGNRVD